jgi:hypothetical protein
MNTATKEIETKTTTQEINLIEGNFTPTEASDILIALIDHKINFHKLERMSVYALQPDGDITESSGRIHELECDKGITKDFISIARREGKKLKISGTIQLTIE